ncbi:MAG: 30S ribosome-binding factor RbfA [Patescibacteria group bacterium]|nr:30S ribosome-binding factor RbfA [Patescibacteria group bacterium]
MSKRIQRVNQLIKRELSQILLREIDLEREILITVTRVETSVDLSQSKVFLSIMPENQAAKAIQILNQLIYKLQQKLNKRLKMRPVPQIKFLEEKKTREAGQIEEILEEIKEKS